MFSRVNPSHLRRQLPRLVPRRFHAYCVGTPKSGTHSIDGLFSVKYRSSHEPEFESLWNMLLAANEGLVSNEKLLKYVRKRDKRLWLELDSSNLNYYLIDILILEFKEAKFILTIRDCYSWLASAIKHRISRSKPVPNTQKKDKFRFGTDFYEYATEEEVLKQYGLPTLDAFLTYWARHNESVIEKVPKDRLLIVKTHEISTSAERIANFIGVPSDTLNHEHSHLFRARNQTNILSAIDRDFLDTKVKKHCTKLMDEFFPGFEYKV